MLAGGRVDAAAEGTGACGVEAARRVDAERPIPIVMPSAYSDRASIGPIFMSVPSATGGSWPLRLERRDDGSLDVRGLAG